MDVPVPLRLTDCPRLVSRAPLRKRQNSWKPGVGLAATYPGVIAGGNHPVRSSKASGLRHAQPCFEPTETVRRARPFARRRFRIARPALVLMRLRKPCFRFLLIRLG